MKYKVLTIFALLITFIFTKIEANAVCPYRIVQDPKGVYIVEINTKKSKGRIAPVVVEELVTNEYIYNTIKPRLVINAGFFDPKNQKTVSYATIDEKEVLNPNDNENLINNEVLKPYLEKILNRSEFRILQDEKGKFIYDITQHNAPIAEGLTLKHSIQAGPMLFPELKLEEEFFVLVRDGEIISESASALHKYARTAIGIRENDVYLFIVTKEAPMTLEEVADLARKWGMEKAMAFDGGGSTSFNSQELSIVSEKDNTGRKLKSFLILK